MFTLYTYISPVLHDITYARLSLYDRDAGADWRGLLDRQLSLREICRPLELGRLRAS